MMGKKKQASGDTRDDPGKKDGPGKKEGHGKKGKNKAGGGPGLSGLPDVVRASGKKVRRIFADARDAALKKRGDTEQADAAAFEALSRTHERVGDRFERKDKATRQAGAAPADAADGATLLRPVEQPVPVAPTAGEEEPAAKEEPAAEPTPAPSGETAKPAETAPALPQATAPAPAKAPAQAPRTSRPAGRGRQADVQSWTTTHLREAARRLEIPGRSRMTREQLVQAVQEAESGGSRRQGGR